MANQNLIVADVIISNGDEDAEYPASESPEPAYIFVRKAGQEGGPVGIAVIDVSSDVDEDAMALIWLTRANAAKLVVKLNAALKD